MKKTPNKPEKPEKQPETTSESLLADVIGTLKFGHDAIRKEMGLIAAGKAADNGHDQASRIAFLTSKLASIVDSIRKVDTAIAKRAQMVTRAQCLAFLRALEPAERAQFIREVQAFDSKRSVLG